MNCGLRFSVLALTLVAAWPGVARAIDDRAKGAARELANEAKRAFDAGRLEEAGRKFQRAYEVAKVPTLAVWTARALAKSGQLVAASELYRQAIQLAPNDLWVGDSQQRAQRDAAEELRNLQPRLPQLRVRVEGIQPNDVELRIDDIKIASALFGVEMPMDPGRRRIVGTTGQEAVEQTIALGEGEHRELVLKFTASPAEQASANKPSATAGATVPETRNAGSITASMPVAPESARPSSRAQRTWGWAAVGVGATGLVMGAVAGIVVLSNSELRGDCQNGVCDSSKVSSSRLRTYNLMRTLSPVGFVVGGVGAAVGITLLLWTPKRESEPRVGFWLGPGSAGVKGAF